MIRLLLVLLCLVSMSKGEVTLRGGVTLSGNVAVSALSSPIRADAVQLFSGQTVGNYITDAQLNTDKIGLGSWSIFVPVGPQPPAYHTFKCVTNTSITFSNPVNVSGQTITATGTKWIEADYDSNKLATSGNTFDGSGNYTISCEAGVAYIWYKHGDTSIIDGSNTYTVNATSFAPAGSTITLTGSPGGPVTSVIVKYLEIAGLLLPGGASPPTPITYARISCFVRLPSLNGSTLNNLDLIDTAGNPFGVTQLQMLGTNDLRVIAHAPGLNGGWIMPLLSNHAYEIVMERDDIAQTVTVNMFDAENNFTSVSGPFVAHLGSTAFTWFIKFQANYLDIGGVGGKLQFGGIAISWANRDSRP